MTAPPAPPAPEGASAHAALLAARPEDLFLRYDVVPGRVSRAHVEGRAVGWTSDHPFRHVRWLTVLADDPAAAADLAARLVAADPRVDGLTLPEAAAALLPAQAAPPVGERWCWWLTDSAPAPRSGEAAVADLALDDARIGPLLAHSASASAFPGDRAVRRWVGVLDGDELLACAAHVEHVPGVPHLASVVTAPGARGRGLAADLCARLTRDALRAGAPVVTLGMYSDNDVARRVYTRLGFVVDRDFSSGYLPGRGPHPQADPVREAPADGGGTV